jgi:nucleotide-binding universal stress UspA family protein
MKKILFPFEIGNPIYKEAYVFAVKLARNLVYEVILLNTFGIEADNEITKEKYARQIKEKWFKAYHEISLFNTYYLEEHARVDTELRIVFDHRFIHGFLKDEILKIAGEKEVDYIVLPLSDRREINKRQLEIIRDHVFEKNHVSLFVLPYRSAYRPLKNIIFLVDLKKTSHFKHYLDEVIHIARVFNSTIHFLHISSKEDREKKEAGDEYQLLQRAIEKNSRHIFKRMPGKNFLESVNQYAEEIEADLLVAIKHQHYFLDSIFHRSQTDEISFHAKIPVLIMRETEYKKGVRTHLAS